MSFPPQIKIRTVLPLPVYCEFDYLITAKHLSVGARVKVPFGQKEKIAICLETKVESDVDPKKLKPLIAVIDETPLLSSDIIKFLRWIADYYFQPLGEVCFLALPNYLKKGALRKPTTVTSYQISNELVMDEKALEKKAPKQYQLLNQLKQSEQGLLASQLSELNKAWQPIMKALVKKQWVQQQQVEQFISAETAQSAVTLNEEQSQVASEVIKQCEHFSVHLIDGITGSGKTEVYFEVMQNVLEQGKQVLFMLPEIGLTNAFIQRLSRRFGREIAIIHSAKTAWQRYIAWDQINRGAANILIATRSGIFVDFKNLGLIIIDEEHDSSYRQQDGVYYHGRDCAVKRAQMLDIPVLMGSATPSVESLKNCTDGSYSLYQLNQRAKGSQLAQMRVINTKDKHMHAGCSQTLKQSISQHLEQQGQVILFLNRRGFAPILMCHDCGWRKVCSECDSQMSLHRSVNKMVCHHCAKQQFIPKKCEDCGSEDIQHYGVGTQQLEAQIIEWFPGELVCRIDRDSTRLKDEFDRKLQLLQQGKSGIFIGTQMLAKGHDYAGITLVGIINMDQGLFSTQYRATENLAQTIIQVSGRAGRGAKKGEVLLQTDFPEHSLIPDLVAQDYRMISQVIMSERQMLSLPPYLKVIIFRAEAFELKDAEDILERIRVAIEQANFDSVKCVGPYPSYIKKQEGRFRAQLHCSSEQYKKLRYAIKQVFPALLKLKKASTTKWRIDVDPMEI